MGAVPAGSRWVGGCTGSGRGDDDGGEDGDAEVGGMVTVAGGGRGVGGKGASVSDDGLAMWNGFEMR